MLRPKGAADTSNGRCPVSTARWCRRSPYRACYVAPVEQYCGRSVTSRISRGRRLQQVPLFPRCFEAGLVERSTQIGARLVSVRAAFKEDQLYSKSHASSCGPRRIMRPELLPGLRARARVGQRPGESASAKRSGHSTAQAQPIGNLREVHEHLARHIDALTVPLQLLIQQAPWYVTVHVRYTCSPMPPRSWVRAVHRWGKVSAHDDQARAAALPELNVAIRMYTRSATEGSPAATI